MMEDILKTDKMFGVVMSDGKGQFCDVGTAVENIKQEIYRGNAKSFIQYDYYQDFGRTVDLPKATSVVANSVALPFL
jgi:hypothetical protein